MGNGQRKEVGPLVAQALLALNGGNVYATNMSRTTGMRQIGRTPDEPVRAFVPHALPPCAVTEYSQSG